MLSQLAKLALVSNDLESAIIKTDIGLSYKSDHSPIELCLKLNEQPRGRGTWKFNNSLLGDCDYVNMIKNTIRDTIEIYKVKENAETIDLNICEEEKIKFTISDQLFWETLKFTIRGKTISFSSFKKRNIKNREQEIEKILKKHFQTTDGQNNVDQAVENLKDELKQIREQNAKGIMMRAKARFKVEGEKSTKFFCNLEKRHNNDKLMLKLINEKNETVDNIHNILQEQTSFYKKLYSSTKIDIDLPEFELFFDKDNPFIVKLEEEESNDIEGTLTITECLKALKNMKADKSPGLDGLTAEFFKFFWSDVKHFLLRSFNESYDIQSLSITQKQGVITCIPKEGKPKEYLKNWRPITLLNVDQKIASAAIANRIKKVIEKIISETQTGFIKGRYMGEVNRLILDMLEETEKENIPGIMLLIDFEKAFDSLEWIFIERALIFFGFGTSIIRWFKTLYCDISSCIINNGHLSDFFSIKRGVRQGDPLSPYLFIIAVELLSAALKNNPDIRGLQINNSSYLISQYADDSTLLLSDDEKSLNTALEQIANFAKCSGLKANFEKTQVIWIGAKRGCRDQIPTRKPLLWNLTGKFKLLGINYNLQKENYLLENYQNNIKSITRILNSWCFRNVSLIGKVTIIKTLAMPILIQNLTVLPPPPAYFYKQINTLFFSFIWDNKPDKIKRNIMVNYKQYGGLQVPHTATFSQSLKYTWIKKILDIKNNSPWKTLFLDKLEQYGGDKFWYLTKEGLKTLSIKFNPFWKCLINSWSDLPRNVPAAPTEIQSQPLWLNTNIKIDKKTILWKTWINHSVFFINDLMNDNGGLMTLKELSENFALNIPFTDYFGLISAIPKHWKAEVIKNKKLEKIHAPLINTVKNNNNVTKQLYKISLENVSEDTCNAHEKWDRDFSNNNNSVILNWIKIHNLPFEITEDTLLQNFQFKLIHRIIFTNRKLFLCHMSETELCSFCNETRETLVHLFFECPNIRTLRYQFKDLLKVKCNIVDLLVTCIDTFIFGIVEPKSPLEDCLNIIFLLMKQYIYSCKILRRPLNIIAFIEKVKKYKELEFYCRYKYTYNKAQKITLRWTCISQLL